MDKHPLDAFFRESLSEAGVQPPARSWERLQSGLAARRRKKAVIWWRSAAAASLLLLGFGAGYLLSDDVAERQPSLAAETILPLQSGTPSTSSPQAPEPATSTRSATPVKGEGNPEPPHLANATQSRGSARNPRSSEGRSKVDLQDFRTEEGLLATSGENRSLPLYLGSTPFTAFPVATTGSAPPYLRGRSAFAARILDPSWLREGMEEVEERAFRLSLGGDVSPLLAMNAPGTGMDASQELVTNSASTFSAQGTEKPRMTFTAGLEASLSLSRRLAVNAGLAFARLGQETEGAGLARDISNYWGPLNSYSILTGAGPVVLSSEQAAQLDYGSGPLTTSEMSNTQVVQQFDYLELPLMVEASLLDRSLRLSLEAGLSAGILVGNRAFVTAGGDRMEVSGTEGLRPLLWQGLAGMGLHVPLGPAWEVSLRPGLRYALSPMNSDGQFPYQPWGATLGTGLRYTLK
ncbi:MAG TPA: outer membrane beta-barrel protein [Bacteroidales bacterium]|nr:outer membrane beta-barrel protein [Bacteroidales bacterium]